MSDTSPPASAEPAGGPPPMPDPGNASPDEWSTDLDEESRDRAFELINEVAVGLPEPDLDGDGPVPFHGAPPAAAEPEQSGGGA